MSNVVRVFLFLGVFFVDSLWADMIGEEDDSSLSLLKAAVSSGIDPAKLISEKSLDANKLLLSLKKVPSPVGEQNEVAEDDDRSIYWYFNSSAYLTYSGAYTALSLNNNNGYVKIDENGDIRICAGNS